METEEKYIVRKYSNGDMAIAFHRACGNQILFGIIARENTGNINDVEEQANIIVDKLNKYDNMVKGSTK